MSYPASIEKALPICNQWISLTATENIPGFTNGSGKKALRFRRYYWQDFLPI